MTAGERWQKLRQTVDDKPRTERVIILVIAAGLLIYGYTLIGFDPLRNDIAALQRQTASTKTRIDAQRSRAEQLRQSSQEDPDRLARERIQVLMAEQAELQAEIDALAGNLISPNSMTQLLTTVLDNQPGLQFVRVENKAPEALRAAGRAASTASGNEALQVYRHGIVLEFAGDYFSVLRYLRYLESLSINFFWDGLSFRQTEWPGAYVILEIHTLSSDEGFIGV